MGAYYAGPGNAFWRTLHEVGFTPVRLEPLEFPRMLEFGLGLTDLCKTRSGSDAEVGRDGFDLPRLVGELERHRPRWIAFTGKNSAQHALGRPVDYGAQEATLGGVPAFVLTSPSGAARKFWDVAPWRELAVLTGDRT